MSRDILSPPLIHLGPNQCYRVNLIHEDFGGPQPLASGQQPVQNEPKGYVEQDLYNEDDDEEEEINFTVEELVHSGFKLTMLVPNAFYGGIIGFKGNSKRRIESETQTEIIVPRGNGGGSREGHGSKSENIIIKGKTRSDVCAARRKINLVVASLRRRMKLTHFVGITLHESAVRQKFVEFKKKILEANYPGIDESLFISESCVHLTLAAVVLLNDAERLKAAEILQSCREFLADLKTPMEMKICGLEIMNDDPSSVRVLYARVEAPVLQEFANRLFERFLRSGFSADEAKERSQVRLHMTVMNNRYRQKVDEFSPTSFDARELLKQFAFYDFGTALCSEVHLCVLHGSSNRDQPYKVTGSLTF